MDGKIKGPSGRGDNPQYPTSTLTFQAPVREPFIHAKRKDPEQIGVLGKFQRLTVELLLPLDGREFRRLLWASAQLNVRFTASRVAGKLVLPKQDFKAINGILARLNFFVLIRNFLQVENVPFKTGDQLLSFYPDLLVAHR
ncbi:MAG TPA: hypothetical protein VKE92_01270 [Anaerolineales bacterium]|nr:hypothetical protein [Anaerolineales bacterium]